MLVKITIRTFLSMLLKQKQQEKIFEVNPNLFFELRVETNFHSFLRFNKGYVSVIVSILLNNTVIAHVSDVHWGNLSSKRGTVSLKEILRNPRVFFHVPWLVWKATAFLNDPRTQSELPSRKSSLFHCFSYRDTHVYTTNELVLPFSVLSSSFLFVRRVHDYFCLAAKCRLRKMKARFVLSRFVSFYTIL